MPQPLPDAVVATLKTDACAALAAIMIVASAHAELLAWAQRALGGKPPGGRQNAEENGNAGGGNPPPPAAALKTRKAPKLDVAAYQARRRARRDADDERLIEAMKQAPLSSVREWGRATGKCRTATVQALHRLRDAGLIESDDGNWALAEAQPATAAAPRWIAPLSGARVARHSADGRVRGELTMAP